MSELKRAGSGGIHSAGQEVKELVNLRRHGRLEGLGFRDFRVKGLGIRETVSGVGLT